MIFMVNSFYEYYIDYVTNSRKADHSTPSIRGQLLSRISQPPTRDLG